MNNEKIIILGGGYAGIQAAKKLHKLFRKKDSVSITLIDRNPFHTLITELHEVAGSRVDEDAIKIPYKMIFEFTNVNVINDNIERINPEEQTVFLRNNKLNYDYLIIATGSEASSFNIPGIDEHAFKLWSLEDALKIKNHIVHMFKTASEEQDTDKRKTCLLL